jgi:hypothetical protein
VKRWTLRILLCLIPLGVALIIWFAVSFRPDPATWTDAESFLAGFPNRMYAIADWKLNNDELVAIGPREIDPSERHAFVGLLLTADDNFAADALRHRIAMRSLTPVVFDYPREFRIIEVALNEGQRKARATSVKVLAVSYQR